MPSKQTLPIRNSNQGYTLRQTTTSSRCFDTHGTPNSHHSFASQEQTPHTPTRTSLAIKLSPRYRCTSPNFPRLLVNGKTHGPPQRSNFQSKKGDPILQKTGTLHTWRLPDWSRWKESYHCPRCRNSSHRPHHDLARDFHDPGLSKHIPPPPNPTFNHRTDIKQPILRTTPQPLVSTTASLNTHYSQPIPRTKLRQLYTTASMTSTLFTDYKFLRWQTRPAPKHAFSYFLRHHLLCEQQYGKKPSPFHASYPAGVFSS